MRLYAYECTPKLLATPVLYKSSPCILGHVRVLEGLVFDVDLVGPVLVNYTAEYNTNSLKIIVLKHKE